MEELGPSNTVPTEATLSRTASTLFLLVDAMHCGQPAGRQALTQLHTAQDGSPTVIHLPGGPTIYTTLKIPLPLPTLNTMGKKTTQFLDPRLAF